MRIANQNTCVLSYYAGSKAYQKSGTNFKSYLQTGNTKADSDKTTPSSSGYSPAKSPKISDISGMLTSIDTDPERALRTFLSSFSKVLKDSNVQLSQPARLQCGTDGNIYVTNNTPDKEKIEELFKNNPELANEFRHASMNAAIAAHFNEALPFYKAYAEDSKAAVAKYSYLFNTNYHDVFSLIVDQDKGGSLSIGYSIQIKRC